MSTIKLGKKIELDRIYGNNTIIKADLIQHMVTNELYIYCWNCWFLTKRFLQGADVNLHEFNGLW